MASRKHQAFAALELSAIVLGADPRAKTRQKQAIIMPSDNTEGAQGASQAALEVTTLSIEEAPASNMESPKPKDHLQSLSDELLCLVFDECTDAKTILAAAMSCKRMYSVCLGHQESKVRILLKHQGVGIVGLCKAATAMTMPYMDDLAARDIDNIIMAMRVFWGGEPGHSSVGDDYRMILWYVRTSLGLGPAPQSTISQDLRLVRREPFLVTEPLAYTSLLESSSSAPSLQLIRSWSIDPNIATWTSADAKKLAYLGRCVRKLSIAYFEYHPGDAPEITEDVQASYENSLWLFESFSQLFGGHFWWKRWSGSINLLYVKQAFKQGRGPKTDADLPLNVHQFLHRAVVGPKLDAVVKAAGVTCGCPELRAQGRTVGLCARCRRRSVEGVLSMGLSAICRVMETDDLEDLEKCFVWVDGLPQQHPFFFDYFLALGRT